MQQLSCHKVWNCTHNGYSNVVRFTVMKCNATCCPGKQHVFCYSNSFHSRHCPKTLSQKRLSEILESVHHQYIIIFLIQFTKSLCYSDLVESVESKLTASTFITCKLQRQPICLTEAEYIVDCMSCSNCLMWVHKMCTGDCSTPFSDYICPYR